MSKKRFSASHFKTGKYSGRGLTFQKRGDIVYNRRMIIGVIADSHGNRVLMHSVADYIRDELGSEFIIHLGDDYSDAEELAASGHNVRMVPGLWCSEYHDGRVPNCVVEDVEGVTLAYTHAGKDLKAKGRAASVVMTGHTHTAAIELIGFSLYFNPGHLKGPKSKDARPSFGIIEIGDGTVRAAIHETDGTLRRELVVERDKLA